MLPFRRSPALLLLASLVLPLASCANSSLGESLQKSFAADPRLTGTASPNPTVTLTPTPQPPPTSELPAATPDPSPTPTPATSPAQPGTPLATIPSFTDSTVIGASGRSDGSSDSPNAASAGNGNSTGSTSSAAGTPTAIDFADVNKTPRALQPYVADLAKLGVLTPTDSSKANQSKADLLFAPNAVITRRIYIRWLVATNNRLYANQAAKQIRLGTDASQPAFQDVPRSDPDFPAIQGMAEAGLIPSPLSGDSTTVTFRPDAPLTRENLILWKVPVDTRQALPMASLDAIRQTWGFQDAARIDARAMRAVLADFQNGDQSNIRRAFGYTTLFQPQKPVTRAEAAAVLWYFGYQGEGQSAQDALKAVQAPA